MLGVGLRCLNATCFAIMGALLKIASLHGANLAELIFYRSLAAIVPVSIWAFATGGLQAVRVRSPMAHATRSAVGITSMIFTFGALTLLPLAQATTISYSAPIAATALSALLLAEQVGPRRWAAVVVGFVGVLFAADPFADHVPLFGLLVGLAAALSQAGVMITIRQIAEKESITAIVFWFTIATTAAAACVMPIFGQAHDLGMLAMLVCAGLFGGFGQIAMTASLRYAPVSVVMPFDYLQMVWATLIGWLVLGNVPVPSMLAGAALIVASGLYTAYREQRRGQMAMQALAVPEA
jgi:drug/metabolite transporter (DMT)-like permease